MYQDASIAAALTALETDYWYDVDHNWGRSAHELYAADGAFVIGDKRMSGRDEIRGFYSWREGRGDRTARHVISNPRVRCSDATRVPSGVMHYVEPIGDETALNLDVFAPIRDDYKHLVDYQAAEFAAVPKT